MNQWLGCGSAKVLIMSKIMALVSSIWYYLSISPSIPFQSFILERYSSEATMTNLHLALVSATFSLRGFCTSYSLAFSISNTITSLSIPWLLSIVSTASSLHFQVRTRPFMRLTEMLRAAMRPRLTGGRPASRKSLSMKVGSSVSITFLISLSLLACVLVMAYIMGSQLRKTTGRSGWSTSAKEGGTAWSQEAGSWSLRDCTCLLASCSQPAQTRWLDRAMIFSFMRYCFLRATLQLGIDLQSLSNRLTPMPSCSACLQRTTGCSCKQSPITTYLLPRISAPTQLGYRHCDASSTITTSKRSGKWWMCSEDRVTNHTRLLLKYFTQSSIEVKPSVWAVRPFKELETEYCDPQRMRHSGSTRFESSRRWRTLSRERLVKVATSVRRPWEWKQWMRLRMSSVLPVPGMPQMRVRSWPEVACRKAQVWSALSYEQYLLSASLPLAYCSCRSLPPAYCSCHSLPPAYYSCRSYSCALSFSDCVPSMASCFIGLSLLTNCRTALLKFANVQLANSSISSQQSIACSRLKAALYLLTYTLKLFISMTILNRRWEASTAVSTTLQPSSSQTAATMQRILKEGRQNSSRRLSSSWLAQLRTSCILAR